MIDKIVSGGQTGADQAALDVAIELGIPHGGWIPKGRKTENGPLGKRYRLKEMPTDSYADRTKQNILDSDGTLIISHGKLTGGSALTRQIAKEYERPWIHVDLSATSAFVATKIIRSWIARHGIRTMNVAGPRGTEDPEIYQATRKLLKALFHLDIVAANMPDLYRTTPYLPRTVKEVVDKVISEMTLRDRITIGNMKEKELSSLLPSLGRTIKEKFGIGAGNHELLQSCRYMAKKYDIREGEASALIVSELWKELRKTHAFRVIK